MSIAIYAAQEDDAAQITAMVNRFAAQNIMLPRSEENVRQTIADWLVAVEIDEPMYHSQDMSESVAGQHNIDWIDAGSQEDDANRLIAGVDFCTPSTNLDRNELHHNRQAQRVVGCGAVVPLTDTLVEIRSLAIDESQHGKGLGSTLVLHLLDLARERKYQQVCALTLRPNFFVRLGFSLVDRWSISPKVWQACIYCPKFHRCDEVAVLMDLQTSSTAQSSKDRNRPAGWNHLLKWEQWQPLRLAYQYKDKEKLSQ